MKKVSSTHFIGIKGVGMTPLAIIAKEAGITVTGSDIPDTFITDAALKEKQIQVFEGFSADHVGNVDVVIVTNAHGGFDNIEALAAKQKQIPLITQAQAVGEFMNGEILGRTFSGISVTGTHGKTTTSAMISSLLKSAKLDPSYIIGTSEIPSLGFPGHLGEGKYFIAEADEYMTESKYDLTPKFLWQHPKILVMTNLEHDHPDVYPDLQSVIEAFGKFVKQLSEEDVLVINGDDEALVAIANVSTSRVISYGKGKDNDYIIQPNIQYHEKTAGFSLTRNGENLGDFTICVSGEHNVFNATAAIIVGQLTSLSFSDIRVSLPKFQGSKRRLEYIGESSRGEILYDDYAHHPTEIKASLKTLRQLFPKHYIVCIFQPHTYSRTKAFFTGFSSAFSEADLCVLTDIYASLREKSAAQDVSSQQLAQAIQKTGKHVEYQATLKDVVKYVRQQKFPSPTLIVTMGAGDVYKILGEI